MSAGMVLLMIVAVLVYCGLLQRVLDRMYLTDRAALLLIGAMLVGTFLPGIQLGRVSVNIGGAVIPFGVCVWLFLKADEPLERWRAALGSVITAAAVYGLTLLLPAEPEALPLDPTYLCALLGGAVAWLLGRSRRCAFICGVLGVLLADTAVAIVNWARGIDAALALGSGGIADAAVLSGLLSVLLCELIGEAAERILRRRSRGGAQG